MTQPTQAQIEAASEPKLYNPVDEATGFANALLLIIKEQQRRIEVAAAQVGMKRPMNLIPPHAITDRENAIMAQAERHTMTELERLELVLRRTEEKLLKTSRFAVNDSTTLLRQIIVELNKENYSVDKANNR